MEPAVAAAIILAFVALGEALSLRSRARIPSLLVTMLALFGLAKLGVIPENLVEASTLAVVGAVLQPAIMIHIGTLVPVNTIKKQYKAVLIAVGGMVVAAALVLTTVTLLFDYGTAVAGVGPLVGGIISTLVTTEGLTDAGFTTLAVIPPLILMLQSLPAMPLASTLLRRYALSTLDPEPPDSSNLSDDDSSGTRDSSRRLIRLPNSVRDNSLILLFLVMLLGAGAAGLGELTGVSYSIFGLVIGIIAAWLGLLPDRALERANGLSVAMLGIIAIVVAPLMGASIQEVLAEIGAVAFIIVVGMAGILIGGLAVSKLVGWKASLGMPVALTAMFGFPADYMIAQEVGRSTGRSREERQQVEDTVMAPMIIGGFTSVSAGSIVIASILVGTL